MTAAYTIGRLSRETGCSVTTIRYFERVGLMPPPARTAGNQRRYGPEHRARLGFILRCRSFGFPQQAVRELLDLTSDPGGSCTAVTDIARERLDDVNRRLDQLRVLKSQLEEMIAVCDNGEISSCRIIEALASAAR